MNEDVIDLSSDDDGVGGGGGGRSLRKAKTITTKKPGPRSRTMLNNTIDVDDSDDSGSDSDFDDPDYMEVPGGGKSLQSIVPKRGQAKSMGTATATTTATATSSTAAAAASNIKTQNKMLVDLIEKGSSSSSSSVPGPGPRTATGASGSGQLFDFRKNDKTKKGNVTSVAATAPGNSGLTELGKQPFLAQNKQMLPNGSMLLPPITVPPGVDPKVIFNQLRTALGMSAKNPHLMNAFTDVMKNTVLNMAGAKAMPAASLNMAALWQNLNAANQMNNFAYKKMGNAGAAAMGADGAGQADDDEDDEEMGVAETYADYKPAKLNLKWYVKHPDPVVETASLSSVEPADVSYQLSLPDETIRSGALSALQLEAITYAAQKHESFLPDGSRAGFLIGDGAGVGKGRTIAGLIFENYQKKRKRSIWVSVSNDLKYDAERDLGDIGAGKIQVYALNKLKYAKISAPVNGTIKKGVIFSTYSSLIGESTNVHGKFKSRLNMLIQWFGDDFDGLIVFDECHRAKNLCPVGSSKPTKTGLTVLELQNRLPKARIVYASATGASEPKNMAYMIRLGMWGMGTPFKEFGDFISTVEKRGVGAMEIVAMDMKLRGMYIARQLSFQGVTFRVENVPLSEEFIRMYDDSVKLWVDLLTKFQEAAGLIGSEGRLRKTIFSQFWSSHQRFFKYLCIAAKVPMAVDIAQESVKCGQCVVIGLQSTGEARTLEQLEREDGELNDFVSTAKGVLQSLIESHFPAPTKRHLDRIYGAQKTVKNGSSSGAGTSKSALAASNVLGDRKAMKRKAAASAVEKSRKRSRRVASDDGESDDSVHIVSSGSEYNDSDDGGGGRRKKNGRSQSKKKTGSSPSSSSESNDSDESDDDDDDDDDDDEDEEESEELESDNDSPDSSDSFVVSDSYDSDSDMSGSDTKPRPKKRKALNKKKSDDKFYEHLLEKKRSLTKLGISGATRDLSIGALANNTVYLPSREAVLRACQMRDELLERVERLGKRLPPNTLDELIDNLGGTENVAEMTGRKGRVVNTGDGVQYESRSENDVPLETLNIAEKQRFMNNEKDVAIISEAASSGISLQSDRRCKNQRRRVHITLELPWSADRAIQQFGRTHRSNQVNAPEYIFMISELAGEKRFASTVAKRLESLGALTHGDRRATKTRDLSQFNIDNKYGRQALETVMKSIMGYDNALVKPPDDYKGDFFKDVADALVGVGLITNSETMPGTLSLDKEYNNISKFLNRILGVTVELQNRLFKYFQDTLNAIILKERRLGRFDLGILDLGTSGEEVRRIKLYRFLRKHSTGIAPTELHIVQVERGMSWTQALEKESTLVGAHEGFYLSHQIRNNKKTAILAVLSEPGSVVGSSNPSKQSYCIYRPNTGLQVRQETLKELQSKYRKVEAAEAQQPWSGQYESAATTCSHAYWRGNCRTMTVMQNCEIGLRTRTYNILAGSVLTVWSRIEHVVAHRGVNNRMQVIRARISDTSKIIGTVIPKNCVTDIIVALSKDAESTEEINF